MERAVAGPRLADAHWLEGADHSFLVLKSSGRSDAEVMDEVARAGADWLGERVS